MHMSVPTNSLDAENLVSTSASELPHQSSASLPRESALVVPPMIGASTPPPAYDIAQCPVESSAAGQRTAVVSVAPLTTADTAVPSNVDPAPTTYSYGTRLKHNIKKPKVRTDGTITYYVVRSSTSEPTSHITAMEHPLWRQAMNDEFKALKKNKTWHLVPPCAGLNVIDCK